MFKKKNNSSDTIETEVPIKYVTYPSNWDDIYNYKYQLGITKKEAELELKITELEKKIKDLEFQIELNSFYKRIYPLLATRTYGQESLLEVEKISTESKPYEPKIEVTIKTKMTKDEYEKFVATKSDIIYLRYLPDEKEIKKKCQ